MYDATPGADGYGAEAGYAVVAQSTGTGRSAEAKLFARITARLTAAEKSGDMAKTAEALHRNNQLWTVLAADVASPDNTLAPELRARLFYLAEFTHQHSRKVLAGEASIGDLIDINKAVMRGLQGNAGAADAGGEEGA